MVWSDGLELPELYLGAMLLGRYIWEPTAGEASYEGMGWDETGLDGIGWDGMGSNGTKWDEIGHRKDIPDNRIHH